MATDTEVYERLAEGRGILETRDTIIMRDYLEILFWRFAKYLIQQGYGYGCEDYNKDCATCRAYKVQCWIDDHIALIKY